MEYHEQHGTANVPQSEGVLGRWVGRQREAKKKGLPEDRVQLLVSFVFLAEEQHLQLRPSQ